MSKKIAAADAMPFAADAFLDVFAAYNAALWPFAVVLWLVTAAVFAAFVRGSRLSALLLPFVLATHWLWAAVMYHAFLFTAINPAAWWFAALFGVQAILIVTMMPASAPSIVVSSSPRQVVSTVLIAYGLAYPLIAWLDGFAYPRMPTFGVPCPTAIVTVGFLVAVPASSYVLALIPIGWSVVAGSAAWVFGIHADFVLPVGAALLAVDLIFRRSHLMKNLSFVSTIVVAATFIVVPASSPVLAQTDQHEHAQQAQKGGTKMDQMKMGGMKMDEKMMGEMAAKKKANTERITSLMAQVKSASGDAKVAAMADVLAVLLEERAAMGEHCASMMSMMKK